jgi:hypothetical protein
LISAAKGLQLIGLYSNFRQNPKPELSEWKQKITLY